MPEPVSIVTDIQPRLTQRRLRMLAFARLFVETMDAAQSYRDIFRPAENPKETDKRHGDKLLRIPYVQTAVGELIKPGLVAMGLDKSFVLRRLIETIDSDITDYVKIVPSTDGKDNADLMSPREMREALPLSKRRLIKGFKVTYDQYGGIKSREIQLEGKQGAIEMLAKIQGWVKPDSHIHIDGDEMMRKIEEARAAAPARAEVLRGEFRELKTFQQLQRPEATAKLIAPPVVEPEKKDG